MNEQNLPKPCIICKKQIEPLENIGYENDAVRCVVRAGYGSRHDMLKLDFIICDDCIDALKNENCYYAPIVLE